MDEPIKRRREKPKKAASLTMRLTQRTRSALEATAEAEGRSISEMAERWLDLAADGKAGVEMRLGGGPMAEALITLAAFTDRLAHEAGVLNPELAGLDPTQDLGVRSALVAGVARLFALIYPIRAHGPSTPDPQPQRDALRQACKACCDDLERITSPPDAPHDMEAFGALNEVIIGRITHEALIQLAEALSRLAALGDDRFKSIVAATVAALDEYHRSRIAEFDALVAWGQRGRALAETLAQAELFARAFDEGGSVRAQQPNSAFGTGALRAYAQSSMNALFEQEQAIELALKALDKQGCLSGA